MEMKYLAVGVVVLLVIFVMVKGKRMPTVGNATEKDIEDLIRAGNKVTAIKYYRAMHGVGLKEAKEAVDELEQSL